MSVTVEQGTVVCDECGQHHEATYSHEGVHGEGAIYEVVCGGLSDFYTAERLLSPVEVARAEINRCTAIGGCTRQSMTGTMLCAEHVIAAAR